MTTTLSRPSVPNDNAAHYRFGFILNTTIGNMTRYVNLRKYAERDPDVEFTWVPVSHWAPPTTRLAKLVPGPIHLRAAVLRQAWPGLASLSRFALTAYTVLSIVYIVRTAAYTAYRI